MVLLDEQSLTKARFSTSCHSCEFVVSTLQQSGKFQIVEASAGLEALQEVEEQQPDLVLLDIGLPNLNGIEVARRLRKLAVPPKIVFLSQESSPEIVGEALNLGALGYVHKIGAGRDLLPSIEAAFEGRRFVSSGLQIGCEEARTKMASKKDTKLHHGKKLGSIKPLCVPS